MTDGFDDGFDGTAKRQAMLGLRMTPAQRLRWLEAKRRELGRLLGLARRAGRPVHTTPKP